MEMTAVGKNTRDIAYIGAGAALMAICSWLSLPTPGGVPITLQTFGVFLTVGVLGGRRGTMAVLVYLLLGMAGVPVFAGFSGGMGAVVSASGGYLTGFLLSALLMWGLEHVLGKKLWALGLSMVLGLAVCYAFGSIWYQAAYTQTEGPASLWTVLAWCVFPFVIPDLVKIALALLLSSRLRRYVK